MVPRDQRSSVVSVRSFTGDIGGFAAGLLIGYVLAPGQGVLPAELCLAAGDLERILCGGHQRLEYRRRACGCSSRNAGRPQATTGCARRRCCGSDSSFPPVHPCTRRDRRRGHRRSILHSLCDRGAGRICRYGGSVHLGAHDRAHVLKSALGAHLSHQRGNLWTFRVARLLGGLEPVAVLAFGLLKTLLWVRRAPRPMPASCSRCPLRYRGWRFRPTTSPARHTCTTSRPTWIVPTVHRAVQHRAWPAAVPAHPGGRPGANVGLSRGVCAWRLFLPCRQLRDHTADREPG